MKNFEKYKTAEEREQAYAEFCAKYDDCGFCRSCPLKSKGDKPRYCTFYWLDLEADEAKLLPCPFCGGEVEITDERTMEEHLYCGCGYTSRNACEDYDYIAAHNRVCKAVAAYKEGEVK